MPDAQAPAQHAAQERHLGTTLRCDQAPAWAALAGHHHAHGRSLDLRTVFANDPQRFERFSMPAPALLADLSKCHWDVATRRALLELAEQCRLPQRRDAMLAGGLANPTEGRAVLHTALRAPKGAGLHSEAVHQVLEDLLAFAEQVRTRADAGELTDVVNIGIGGSDLGPAMAIQALQPFAHRTLRVHCVSNVDALDLSSTLAGLQARRTVFIVVSKTFTTQETMSNAALARQWFLAQGMLDADVAQHFVGVTTNTQAAAAWGITRTFGFWDWVGGRYSVWGAVGLALAMAVGERGFRQFLAGGHAMDQHFAHTEIGHNLPILLGLLDVWYGHFMGYHNRCVLPYHHGLRRLPAYLQQLEMESNGKSVASDGSALPPGLHTSPVVWGEAGTNAQHAFMQMLHQGTQVVPVEFIVARRAEHAHVQAQAQLLAHCLAQSRALMVGKTSAQAATETVPTAAPGTRAAAIAQHRSFAGNRPSATLMLDDLSPHSLGALLALYEHRVWTSGALWGINSFDQWGVELGKAMANSLLPLLAGKDPAGEQALDASTLGLLRHLRAG